METGNDVDGGRKDGGEEAVGDPAHRVSEDLSGLVSEVKTFVFDCDGVIWRGAELIDGVAETLDYLRNSGKDIMFITNNSTRCRAQLAEKFTQVGLDWVTKDHILSSSYAAAEYLHSALSLPRDKKVYVIGEQGIVREMREKGYICVGAEEHRDMSPSFEGEVAVDPEIGAVVIGFDLHFNYFKMVYATKCLQTLDGCHFVATNRDARSHFVPTEEWPGGGTMVAALAYAIGYEPHVAGKPNPFLVQFLREKLGHDPSDMCMVGDRLDTDIMFGNQTGMKTLLVLSGVTPHDHYHSLTPPTVDAADRATEGMAVTDDALKFPDFAAKSVAALHPELCKK